MTTKRDFAVNEESIAAGHSSLEPNRPAGVSGHRRRNTLWGLGAAGLAGALALGVFGGGDAHGEVSPLQIIALAPPAHSNEESVKLQVKGPSDVLQTELVFQPGAETGWHFHPGPVIVVIKSGSLTEYQSDGCILVHPAGSAFFEKKDEIHNAVNQTSGVTDVYATFLSPSGAQPLIPASNPGAVCGSHKGGRDE